MALLAAALSIGACHPRLGGTHATETGMACPAGGASTEPSPEPEAVEPGRPEGGGGGGEASAADGATALSTFGLLTPLFPGGASQGVTAPCDLDDFYGGCL